MMMNCIKKALSLLFIAHIGLTSELECREGDRQRSLRTPVVSGIGVLPEGKSIVTLGYKELQDGIRHAYLVFETPSKVSGRSIDLEGVHLGTDGCGGIAGVAAETVYGWGKSVLYIEARETVLIKFLGSNSRENGEDVPSFYKKHISFIVDERSAKSAIDLYREDNRRDRIKFTAIGWRWLSSWHFNCCSYVLRLLRAMGLDLRSEDGVRSWVYDHHYLNSIIEAWWGRLTAVQKATEAIAHYKHAQQ